ncbi:MAG TPA: hypothetical protein VI382_09565, partial [Candidatus Manganitrophaceae bacterium]|nr:hypothetical protein [Candidatus Manganitrophaceae bacterium]
MEGRINSINKGCISLFIVLILLGCEPDPRNQPDTTLLQPGWNKSGALSRGSFFALATDPADPNIVYAASSLLGVYKTTDGGATWAAAISGLPGRPVGSLQMDRFNPSILYAAVPGGGVYVTKDGAQGWAPLNQGLTQTSVHAVAFNPFAPPTGVQVAAGNGLNMVKWNAVPNATEYKLYVCVAGCVGTSTSSGSGNWQERILIADQITKRQYSDEGLINGNTYYYVVKSIVGGAASPDSAMVSAVPKAPPTGLTVEYPQAVTVTVGNNQAVIGWNSAKDAVSYEIYKGGISIGQTASLTFTDISAQNGIRAVYYVKAKISNGSLSDQPSAEVSAVPGPTSALYVGTAEDGVFVSGPDGEYRSAVNTGLTTSDGLDIDELVIDPVAGGPPTLYAGTRDGVYRTKDGGQTWTAYNTNLSQNGVLSLAYDPAGGILYAGTPAGIFKTAAKELFPLNLLDANWQALGLGSFSVTAIAVDPLAP